jgi:hypothetical protein
MGGSKEKGASRQEKGITTDNSTIPKVAVQCLNQAFVLLFKLCAPKSPTAPSVKPAGNMLKEPTHIQAHLVFTDTRANAQKENEPYNDYLRAEDKS